MLKLTIEHEDGRISVVENVLDYNYVDVDLCQDIAIAEETKLSDEEIKEVQRQCERSEQLPDIEHLREIIFEIINERE